MFGDELTQPSETLDDILALDSEESEEEVLEDEEVTETEDSEAEESEDEESPEDEDEDEQDDPTVEIEHNGKVVNLKQSELKELAQKGFDYTQKTMALAEERKAFDTERTQVSNQRQHYESRVEEASQALQAAYQFAQASLGEAPDPSLAYENSGYYLELKAQHEARQAQLGSIAQMHQQLTQQAQRERQETLQRRGVAAEADLKGSLEGWNDAMAEDLAQYAANNGLAPHEVDAPYVTAGFWKLLAKAKAYDTLQATKANIKPTKTIAKVAKPKAAPGRQPEALRRANAEKAFSAKPTIHNLANLLD
ncbi:hypothetical protein V3390_09205 [Luteimonas sp. FXH3W]|uniref:Scaffolding protein n=1 Tax=Aquilutibacter rugosus TaxID=3115820 RepID=A0ABU7V3I9_9GAMM